MSTVPISRLLANVATWLLVSSAVAAAIVYAADTQSLSGVTVVVGALVVSLAVVIVVGRLVVARLMRVVISRRPDSGRFERDPHVAPVIRAR